MAAKKNKSIKLATKKTKKNDPEKLVREAIKKNQWILFVGGTNEERERLAKFAHKNKPLIKKWEKGKPSIIKSLKKGVKDRNMEEDYKKLLEKMPNYPKPLNLDGYSGNEIYDEVVKKIEYFKDKTPGEEYIAGIYLTARTLFINNLCCENKDDVKAIKKLTGKLREYRFPRSQDFSTVIVGLEKEKDFKKLPQAFKDLFQVIKLTPQVKDEKISSVRISDNKLKKIFTQTRKELKEETPGGFKLDILFKEVSEITKDKKINPSGKGLTPSTVKTRYYELFPKK